METKGKTEMQKLYDKIPASVCKKGCFDCCGNVVQFAPEELSRAGEYALKNGKCVFLTDKGCSIYENRPFVCRLFGTSEIASCAGCVPERFLSREETLALSGAYAKLKNEQEKNSRR